MEFIRRFDDIDRGDAALAGGKGASLGEMYQAGIPVPPGCVILAEAFEEFLRVTDLGAQIDAQLDKVKHEEMHTVEHASETIQSLILKQVMPNEITQLIESEFAALDAEFVAVRSSATAEDSSSAAWAGQLDSFLNTNKATLLTNVQRCWASLFTPRAIFYRFEKGMHGDKISVAVVVQKMIASECSGIAFSVHPVTEDYNQLIIEAGYGLGEAIVSGSITPDSYVVEKEPRRIIDKNVAVQERALYRKEGGGNEWRTLAKEVGEKQVLSDDEILELSEIILHIEQHYGFPCDIEWAREGGKFYIVQSRPITTLNNDVTSGENKSHLEKIIFMKSYSRDTTLFVQGLWAMGLHKLSKEKFGWNNPHLPLIAHVMNEGVVEIWENKKAIDWFLAHLLEKNINDPKLLERLLVEYRVMLLKLKQLEVDALLGDAVKIEQYTQSVYRAAFIVTLFFYTGIDERSPKEAQEIAVRGREEADFFAEQDVFARKSIAKIGGISEELAGVVLPSELSHVPSKEVLSERLGSFLILDGREGCVGSLSSFMRSNPSYVFEGTDLPQDQTDIRGQIAYPGVLRGKVKIVKKQNQMSNVEEGDIMVSPMTTPDFLPAMQKAAAFVTDEGGITCHAAIVAREMKKPCIIGTKIATQMLHDGDFVEVDADNGVVRVLERG